MSTACSISSAISYSLHRPTRASSCSTGREVDLGSLAIDCVQAAQPAAERAGVKLVIDSESSRPVVADSARIGQLLDNLISNAIKFTPDGGRVDVSVDSSEDVAVIEVRDNGFGIGPKDQEQLFERFFRTQSATEKAIAGTGLGLSIVKAIVDAHGGTISVESAEGVGTTFRVELPLVPDSHAALVAV